MNDTPIIKNKGKMTIMNITTTIVASIAIISLLFLTGCASSSEEALTGVKEAEESEITSESQPVVHWLNATYTDVTTGEAFTFDGLRGQTVLLEPFAIWCPTCKKQKEVVKSIKEEGINITSISIDVDPNEDAKQVKA